MVHLLYLVILGALGSKRVRTQHQAVPQLQESDLDCQHHIRLDQHQSTMSENGEVEVENPSGYTVLPKEVTAEIGTIKLFNKWSYEDVEVRDISLT